MRNLAGVLLAALILVAPVVAQEEQDEAPPDRDGLSLEPDRTYFRNGDPGGSRAR